MAILPFPIVRHCFVGKQVAHASQMNPESGVRYPYDQIKLQGHALRRRGIDKDLIQSELRSLLRTKADNPGGES